MLAPVRTVAPTLNLFSLEEVKAHLRVDGNDEDTLIEALRDAVIDHLDGWSGILGRCLLSQSWRQELSCFPGGDRIRLPLMPVSAITSITYRDTSDVSQTLATTVYAGPFHDELGAYVILKYGQTWQNTYTREDAVAITFVAGYASAATVPKAIRQAALILVGDLFENREHTVIGASAVEIPMPMTAAMLLGKYRRIGL